jgi:hypothetical protein
VLAAERAGRFVLERLRVINWASLVSEIVSVERVRRFLARRET